MSPAECASDPQNPAIFLHSLFRTGSTYLFQKFRETGDFYCFQEPCNEELIELNLHPERLAKTAAVDNEALRHPALKDPYFHEFYLQRHALSGLFQKSFSFDDYFTGATLSRAQKRYFQALLDVAPKRAFLQFCRTAGRVEGMKRELGGLHAHLWREPRGQWWSYKISDYFDATTQAIYNAADLPPVLAWARREASIVAYRDKSVNREIRFHRQHLVHGRASYLAFFSLWLYAFIEYSRHATLDICVNRLQDQTYRAKVVARLYAWDIKGVSFEDAEMPATHFSKKECSFYEEVEAQVQASFLQFGYPRHELDAAFSAIVAIQGNAEGNIASDVQKELSNLRALAFRHWEQSQANVDKTPGARKIWTFAKVVKTRRLWN